MSEPDGTQASSYPSPGRKQSAHRQKVSPTQLPPIRLPGVSWTDEMNLKKNPRSDSKATALKAGEVKDEGRKSG